MSHRHRIWVAVTAIIATIVCNVGAVVAMKIYDSPAPLGLAAGLSGMFAFVSMLVIASEPGAWRVTEAAMRTAIATAIVAQYLALVSMAAFRVEREVNQSPLSDTLISNFTTIVGIVIAFYFGASAFVEARTRPPVDTETRNAMGSPER